MSLFGIILMIVFTIVFIIIYFHIEAKLTKKLYVTSKENNQRYSSKRNGDYQTKFKRG